MLKIFHIFNYEDCSSFPLNKLAVGSRHYIDTERCLHKMCLKYAESIFYGDKFCVNIMPWTMV